MNCINNRKYIIVGGKYKLHMRVTVQLYLFRNCHTHSPMTFSKLRTHQYMWMYIVHGTANNSKYKIREISLSFFLSLYFHLFIYPYLFYRSNIVSRCDKMQNPIQTKTHTNIQYQYQHTHTHILTMSSVKALASLQLISVLCWNGSFMHNCNMHNNDIANQKSTNICMHTSEHTAIHASAQNMETHLVG